MWNDITASLLSDKASLLAGLLPLLAVMLVVLRRFVRRRKADKRRHHTARADRDDALRLLQARLDSGNITQEQFDQLRRTVES